jgi:hypothetical protein
MDEQERELRPAGERQGVFAGLVASAQCAAGAT